MNGSPTKPSQHPEFLSHFADRNQNGADREPQVAIVRLISLRDVLWKGAQKDEAFREALMFWKASC